MFTVSDVQLALVGSRFIPVRRDVVLASEIALTPYAATGLIDAGALVGFFHDQLRKGHVDVAEIDSGAVILTGNALERENSRLVGDVFAELAGKFVVTSAGDDLEAMLSAFGSGAVAVSRTSDAPVVHVDIGGGTTKFALCERGRVSRTSAIRVGARIVAVDPDGRVVHATPTGRQLLRGMRLVGEVGSVLDLGVRRRLATYVVDRIFDVLTGKDSGDLRQVLLAGAFAPPSEFVITFGGGVSEYIYGREERSFGDLGPDIGHLVRERLHGTPIKMVELPRGIRSTVTGASQYTVQVTSQTVDVSSDAELPLRNVPILVLDVDALGDEFDAGAVRDELSTAVAALSPEHASTVGVGLLWSGSATYGRLDAIAQGLVTAMGKVWGEGRPAVVVTDADIGGLIGGAIRRHLAEATVLISVDGIECRQFDHVDIGTRDAATRVLPVVVKSLLFPPTSDPAERAGDDRNGVSKSSDRIRELA